MFKKVLRVEYTLIYTGACLTSEGASMGKCSQIFTADCERNDESEKHLKNIVTNERMFEIVCFGFN